MSAVVHDDAATVLRALAAATAAIAVAALLVHVTFAADARSLLHYPFDGVPPTSAEAWGILTINARKLAGLFGLTLIVQSPWLSGERAPDERPRAHSALVVVCDAAAAASLASTVASVVLGLGGYGARMLVAILPHGPIEAAAFTCALVLYAAGRRRRLAPRRALTLSAASLLLLAVAACLETFMAV
jgi:hypothetical protein